MFSAERRLYDHTLTFLVEMLIADDVDTGYCLFDQQTLGAKLASINDVNRRVLFSEDFSWGQAAYLDVVLAASMHSLTILIELELESPTDDDPTWRELVVDAVHELGCEVDPDETSMFTWETLVAFLLDRHSGFRDDEVRDVLDADPCLASELKKKLGLPFDYHTRIPADLSADEVCKLLSKLAV